MPEDEARDEIVKLVFPADLIALQCRFNQADAHCEKLAATHPRATDIAAGTADITETQRALLQCARTDRLNTALALQAHPFWATVKNRFQAKQALREAAKYPVPGSVLPAGYSTIHAHVRFTERYEAHAAISGHVDVFEAGEWINPVALDMSTGDTDPTSPTAVWYTEPLADTGVHAGDWLYIPGSVVEVIEHWPA